MHVNVGGVKGEGERGAVVVPADPASCRLLPPCCLSLTQRPVSCAASTDSSGQGNVVIDLGALPPANQTSVNSSDTLSVKVEWVGPTRELIIKTATLRWGPA